MKVTFILDGEPKTVEFDPSALAGKNVKDV